MMKSILDADGAGVSKISGYVIDKLGGASNAALQRLGDRMARELGDGWKAIIVNFLGRDLPNELCKSFIEGWEKNGRSFSWNMIQTW
jgi:hypothetical protein